MLLAILLNLLTGTALASANCKQVVSIYQYTLADGVTLVAGEASRRIKTFDNEFFCVNKEVFSARYVKNGETLKEFTIQIEAGNHYEYEGSLPRHPNDNYFVKIYQPTKEDLILRFGNDWNKELFSQSEDTCVKLTVKITCRVKTNRSLIIGDEVVNQGDGVELCVTSSYDLIPVEVATPNLVWYADENDAWIRNYGTYLSKQNNWEWHTDKNYCTVDISPPIP